MEKFKVNHSKIKEKIAMKDDFKRLAGLFHTAFLFIYRVKSC